MRRIPILLITHDRPYLLDKVINRIIRYTDFSLFELWILDNASTSSNKKIIKSYVSKYPFIKVFSQNVNQISLIQNSIVYELKRDIYIKLDDDILVSEGWTNGFVNLLSRQSDISFGSVVIPINGFGWTLFLENLNLVDRFREQFPKIELKQGCMEAPVWWNNEVVEYIWNECLDLEKTTQTFLENQHNSFKDLVVPFRYSIGAISFSHDFWEKMGGWKIEKGFMNRVRIYNFLDNLNNTMAKARRKPAQRRVSDIIKIITRMNISALGIEEEFVFKKSCELGLKQYVTTESIVYHFSFFTTEEYLLEKVFLNIKF